MALVASYGGDSSSEEEVDDVVVPIPPLSLNTVQKVQESQISDEEDRFTDEEIEDIGHGIKSAITSSLPQPLEKKEASGFIDEKEDVSDIPVGKVYGGEESIERPAPSNKRDFEKKKVQIKLPTLKSLFKDLGPVESGDSDSSPSQTQPQSAGNKSISAFLPPPKRSLSTAPSSKKPINKPVLPFVPRSLSKKPAPPPSKRRKDDSSDDEEEEDNTTSSSNFFTFHDKTKEVTSSSYTLPLPTLNPSMEVPLEAEPLVGPSKPKVLPPSTYPTPVDLMGDEVALERLGGKQSLRKKEHITNVVEINGEDNRPDPKIWLTKAVTEDELSKPGPRVTIKGVQKTRHQITYLAQLAKANEFKLQQEWANNAHSRRQSAQKYGF